MASLSLASSVTLFNSGLSCFPPRFHLQRLLFLRRRFPVEKFRPQILKKGAGGFLLSLCFRFLGLHCGCFRPKPDIRPNIPMQLGKLIRGSAYFSIRTSSPSAHARLTV